jgi:hypothetical protein
VAIDHVTIYYYIVIEYVSIVHKLPSFLFFILFYFYAFALLVSFIA